MGELRRNHGNWGSGTLVGMTSYCTCIVHFRITDVQNETKDKVKYLEALRRNLEQLHLESNPVAAVNVVLPTLIAAMRQMDSISRFYARNGYLGLLCMKVSLFHSFHDANCRLKLEYAIIFLLHSSVQ